MLASNPEGELHISYPKPDDYYWVAFQNHGHATAFLDILGQLNVYFSQSQEKPEGFGSGESTCRLCVLCSHLAAPACELGFGASGFGKDPLAPVEIRPCKKM